MPGLKIQQDIIVNAPVDRVFNAYSDPLIMTEWFTAGLEIRGYQPPLAVGQQFEEVSTIMGRQLVTHTTVTELDPPRRYVRAINGPAVGHVSHIVESVASGVKVTVILEGDLKGFLASLAGPLARAQINRQVKNDLKSFKAYIEG